MSSGLFQQLLRGDYGVEEAVEFGFATNEHDGDILSVSGGEYITFGRENAIEQFHARRCQAQKRAIMKEAA